HVGSPSSIDTGVRSGRTVYEDGGRSEHPGPGVVGPRHVGADETGPDRAREVLAERGVLVADASDGILDALRDGEPGALRARGGAPVTSPQTDGGGELVPDELHLRPCGRRASRIVRALGILTLRAQIGQSTVIRRPCSRVEV